MIRSLLSVVASFALVACTASAAPPSDRLLDAIATVESGNNPDAVGDGGKAIGVFQIWRVYWQDAVQHDPSIGGCYEDCRDPEYARRIVIAYMDRYAPANASDETLARIHNGGPRGHKKAATTKYWNKVKKAMK
jgi:hypothetical protein